MSQQRGSGPQKKQSKAQQLGHGGSGSTGPHPDMVQKFLTRGREAPSLLDMVSQRLKLLKTVEKIIQLD